MSTLLVTYQKELDVLISEISSFSLNGLFTIDASNNDCYELINFFYFTENNDFLDLFFSNHYCMVSSNNLIIAFFEQRVFIFPNALNDVFCISYSELDFNYSEHTFNTYNPNESGELVSQTWEHTRRDGGPDRRFNNNCIIYVMRYFNIASKKYPQLRTRINNLESLNKFLRLLTKVNSIGVPSDSPPIFIKDNKKSATLVNEEKKSSSYNCNIKKPNDVSNSEDSYLYNIIEANPFIAHDLVYNDYYGRGMVMNVNDKNCEILFVCGVKTIYFTKLKKESFHFKEYDINSIFPLYCCSFYNPFYGSGKLLKISQDMVSLLFDNKGLIEINFMKLNFLSQVDGSLTTNKLAVNCFIIATENKAGIVSSLFNSYAYVFLSDGLLIKHTTNDLERIDSHLITDKLLLSRSRFINDYYSYSDASKILLDEFGLINEYYEVVNQMKILKYNFVDGVFLKAEYSNLKDYLLHKFSDIDVYRYDYAIQSKTYDKILKSLVVDFYCIPYDDGVFYTSTNIIKKKISEVDYSNFIFTLKSLVSIEPFINLDILKRKRELVDFSNVLSDFALNYYLSFLLSVKTFILNGKKFYSRNIHNIKELGVELVKKAMIDLKLTSADIYDVKDKIMNLYDVKLEINDIIGCIDNNNNSSLFYSSEMEKIYLNKKMYYKEIYKND